jgi:hypothetical protein
MQPASQNPEENWELVLLIVGIAFLIIGILYIFSREASRREHLKKWLTLVGKVFLSCLFLVPVPWWEPRSKIAREETDHEAPQAEVGPGAGTKDRRS